MCRRITFFDFFVLLFVIIFLITPFEDQIISITIVIPRNFAPYYDWLMNFPGWKVSPQIPAPHPTPMLHSHYSVTPFHDLITYPKPVRNNHLVKSQI